MMTETLIFFLVALAIIIFHIRAAIVTLQKRWIDVDKMIDFPFLTTLTINRTELPHLSVSGVYDAIDIRRNPYALEMRLINSTGVTSNDPFSFFVPLQQDTLRQIAEFLNAEADRLDKEGNPFFK